MTTNGAVITDASGSIFAYKLSGVNIQDKVKISAKVGQFNKGFQLACDGVSAEVLSSGNAITYPPVAVSTESDLTAIVAPDLFLAQYATVQGKVTTDSHNNAIISVGSQTVKSYYGTVSYADYADKTVEMSGYVISYKSPTVNMVVTSIKEIAGGEEGGEEGGEGGDTPVEDLISKNISEISGVTTDGTSVSTMNFDEVVTLTASSGSNNGKVYSSGAEWRFYQSDKGTLTVTAKEGYTLEKIKVTYTPSKSGVLMLGDAQLATDSIADVSGNSVVLAVGNTGTATNGQVKITAISLKYKAN